MSLSISEIKNKKELESYNLFNFADKKEDEDFEKIPSFLNCVNYYIKTSLLEVISYRRLKGYILKLGDKWLSSPSSISYNKKYKLHSIKFKNLKPYSSEQLLSLKLFNKKNKTNLLDEMYPNFIGDEKQLKSILPVSLKELLSIDDEELIYRSKESQYKKAELKGDEIKNSEKLTDNVELLMNNFLRFIIKFEKEKEQKTSNYYHLNYKKLEKLASFLVYIQDDADYNLIKNKPEHYFMLSQLKPLIKNKELNFRIEKKLKEKTKESIIIRHILKIKGNQK